MLPAAIGEDAALLPLEDPTRYSAAWVLIHLTRLYRRSILHHWKHRNGCPCLFIPTCREYLERAVVKYGFWEGIRLGWKRLRRCNSSYRGSWVDFP